MTSGRGRPAHNRCGEDSSSSIATVGTWCNGSTSTPFIQTCPSGDRRQLGRIWMVTAYHAEGTGFESPSSPPTLDSSGCVGRQDATPSIDVVRREPGRGLMVPGHPDLFLIHLGVAQRVEHLSSTSSGSPRQAGPDEEQGFPTKRRVEGSNPSP